MKKTYKDYVLDILEAMNEVRDFTAGISLDEFYKDKKTLNAVLRSLEVMGEASKKIPEEIRKKHAGIPWKRMAGFRDKLIHEYFGLDLDIIWGVVQNELPPLEPVIQEILKGLEEET